MRTILCFGDSNTWGYDGKDNTGLRYPRNVRWTGVLKEHLGKNYEVIEEGLNGRTTVLNHPITGKIKNGKKYLPACLASHTPIDLVIIMLGSNDAKACFALTAEDIAMGMDVLLNIIKNSACGPNHTVPHILLMSPPPMKSKNERYKGGEARLKALDPYYYQLSQKYGCSFLEARKFATTLGLDGLHLDAKAHKKLGVAVSAMVTRIFKE